MVYVLHACPPSTKEGAFRFYFNTLRDEAWHGRCAVVTEGKATPTAVDVLTYAMLALKRRGALRLPHGITVRELAESAVVKNQPGVELDLHPLAKRLAEAWTAATTPSIPKA